jgi:predicted DNA-binding protein YlxM (UPF0122 family)
MVRKSIDWHMKVAKMYNLKWSMQEISDYFRVDMETVHHSITVHSEITGWYDDAVGIHFGSKKEAYQTEKEMLKGYRPPKYSQLSKEERAIYKSL